MNTWIELTSNHSPPYDNRSMLVRVTSIDGFGEGFIFLSGSQVIPVKQTFEEIRSRIAKAEGKQDDK